jgi:hypothetical protein
MQKGWISLHRRIMEKGWYKKPDHLRLWIHILLKASHEGKQFWFNGKNTTIKAGQFITGRKALSIEIGISESKIERILNYFEKSEQQIEQQKSNKNRLISVVNWQQYQNIKQQNEQQVNNKRTTSEQQVNTINNDNNYNNVNKYIARPRDLGMVQEYFREKKYPDSEAVAFWNYFESIGWIVGKKKTPMKKWRNAVGNWMKDKKNKPDKSTCGFDVVSTEDIMTESESINDKIKHQKLLLSDMDKSDPDWELENNNLKRMEDEARNLRR